LAFFFALALMICAALSPICSYYEKGVACPRCFGTRSTEQLNRYKERQHQIELAKARGEEHIGDNAAQIIKLSALSTSSRYFKTPPCK
jgi:predicted sulfurtransferase